MPPDPPSQPHDHEGEHDHLKKLGKYQIQKKLGAGGMGTVFLAVDTDLKRTVALKVLAKERAENPTLVKRFKAEAQSAAQLTHPNIVSVYEAGQADGFLYIALEYVEGIDTLELLRKRGIVPVKRSIDIIKQTCKALQHAHEKGIVHRDIKPSNLMIRQDGVVKLADMGLARSVDDTIDTNITRAGTTVGTVDYMSPEQARDSRAADIRSDIYSLGCTWYHLLTGSIPYPEGSLTNKLQAHATGKIPDPRSRNSNIPEGVVAVMRRMMAKKKEERYQSPAELIQDLETAALGRSTVTADVLAGLAEEADSPVSGSASETAYTESDSSTSEMESRRSASSAVADPPPKSKFKKGGKHSQVRKPTPTRGVSEPRPSKSNSPSGSHQRTLPPREVRKTPVGDDEDNEGGGINPDHIKYAILGLLVIGIAVVVFFAIRATGENMGGGGLPLPTGNEGDEAAPNNVPQQAGQGVDAPPDADVGQQQGLTEFQTHQAPEIGTSQNQETGPLPEFPGADHLEEGDRGDWLPGWSSDLLSDERLGELEPIVVSDQPAPGQFRNLSDALAQVPQSGGIIEFAGTGPFELPPLSIREKVWVMLRAGEGSRPLISCVPSEGGQAAVSISNGLLLIEGIDFLTLVAGGPAPPVIQVSESRLRMRDCSITVAGATEPSTAIALNSNEQRTVECALERVLIRGDHLTIATLAGPRVDLLVGNSLLWSGQAPCLRLKGSAASISAPAGRPTRAMRLLATTCCSQSIGIELDSDGITNPAGFELKLLRSAFVHVGDQAGTWADVTGWPVDNAAEDGDPRLKVCTLASDGVRFVGWQTLLRCTSPGESEPTLVSDSSSWREFWGAQASDNEFLASHSTPEAARASDDFVPAVGAWLTILNEEIGARVMTIGGDFNEWPRAPQGLIARTIAISNWPYMQEDIVNGWQTNVTREFDLNEDGRRLGRFIDSAECPDGTHIIAYGEGVTEIEWLQITGKRIRLQFVQRGENRLIIRPRQGGTGDDRTAWITVSEGGLLDLIGGHLRLPAVSNHDYPRRLLLANGGRFVVRNCILEGDTVGNDIPVEPLVEWAGDDLDAGEVTSCLIDSSMLSSPVTALHANLGNRQLYLRNSVITGLSEGVSVSLTSGAEGWLVLDSSTLAPSAECLAITFDAIPAGTINVWANESVFGPPLLPDAAAGLVSITGGASENVLWWEDRCGYSDRRSGGVTGQGWGSLRGDGHALRFAEGVRAVLLSATLPEPRDLTVASFQLSPDCDSAHWDGNGREIGADIEEVGPQGVEAPADPNPTPRPDPGF